MKIAMPIQNPEELEITKAAGASEVYCGVLTDAWMDLYGAHDSANRRQGLANLQGIAAMRAVGQEARRIDLPAYLTLNARYTGPQYPDLLRLAGVWAEAGGTGVHLMDLGFLHAFVRERFGLRISVSLLSVTLNAHTAAYYAALGARRIVFPRCLQPREMGAIMQAHPDLEGEAMVIGDQCAFIDGLCRCYHGVAYADGAGTPAHTLHSFDTTSGPHGCHLLLGDADPGVPCAACRLAELEASGVGIGKMGGRGTPLPERIGRLSFLRQAQALGTPQAIRALYAQRFGTPCRCYYPQ